jgi:hypothetical protein
MLGTSVDATWSHDAFARTTGIGFPRLADDALPGAVARADGVYVPETGRSRRALFVINPRGGALLERDVPRHGQPGRRRGALDGGGAPTRGGSITAAVRREHSRRAQEEANG